MTAYEFGRVKFLLTDINISTGILLKEANSAFNFFFFFLWTGFLEYFYGVYGLTV